MFDKILIANRGEIACRIIETAHSMGIACVAVYSDVDRNAKHVAMADQAVNIGSAAPAESYLRGDRIITAATATKAAAIHPGYGFLSENPDFAEAVTAAGLVFIGPSAEAIRAMGLKDAAKKLMQAGGVPVVPGYHGDNQAGDFLAQQASQIGYPVLIKAVAGGGGKGMRLVKAATDFDPALKSAQSEAMAGFGNATVLIEKYIAKPRHIEFQIFGDGQKVVHLFERDCSLQRRYQKVIEEAPAPGMTDAMRAAMGSMAVKAATLIGYAGAGTVEFIVDASDGLRLDRFWFMEMNTRLQVEHPVTEAVTGVDLVEWQLRVAAGETIPTPQAALRINGHAIEARLYAEDPNNNFLPVTGRLSHLQFSPLARCDSGVRRGDEISPHYDPMIAKLITHGPNRDTALARMSQALQACEVAGTVTNLAFLGSLLTHRDFASGFLDTGLIARDLAQLAPTAQRQPEPWLWAQAALLASGLDASSDWANGFTLWGSLEQFIELRHGAETRQIKLVTLAPDKHRFKVDGRWIAVRWDGTGWWLDDHAGVGGSRSGEIVTLFSQCGLLFEHIDPLARSSSDAATKTALKAPMPGTVRSVLVERGQHVTVGDQLLVLEAMKMEHSLQADRDAVIAQVLVLPGAQVAAEDELIRFYKNDGTDRP